MSTEETSQITFDRHQNFEGYEAEIIADSISPAENRLTTFDLVFPRMVLAEFNTHKVFSRNSASSRAIPVEKQLNKLINSTYTPIFWGKLEPGMQSYVSINSEEIPHAIEVWEWARNAAVLGAVALIGGKEVLKDEGLQQYVVELENDFDPPYSLNDPVHKQWANRLLEPYMWHEVLVTATDWENFYALRANQEAQPEIQVVAQMMIDAYEANTPELVEVGEWHTPLIREEEKGLPLEQRLRISIGRCARVSYLTHDGKRDLNKDENLYLDLVKDGHMSPTEHAATPFNEQDWKLIDELRHAIRNSPIEQFQKKNLYNQIVRSGNFEGWHQHRKMLPYEDNYGARPNQEAA